jgi:two-component system sensor histidine kinase CpxA
MAIEPHVAAAGPIRFPLAWKILLWFSLNVLFLAGGAVVVAEVNLKLRVYALLAGRADERLQALSSSVIAEIDRREKSEWGPILKRFADENQVQLAVFRNDGSWVAGEIDPLPQEVVSKLADRAPGDRRPPFERRGRPPGRRGEPDDSAPGDGPPPERVGAYPGGEGPPPEGGPGGNDDFPPREHPMMRDSETGPRHKFALRAGMPPSYWVGMRTLIRDTNGFPLGPNTLMLRAKSLGAGGLLFDYKPLLIVGAGVLLCSMIFWIPLVRGITRSVRQMTRAAGAIAQGEFETKIDAHRADELGQLGLSLNHMAGRLREYFTGQKRLLGDIAHELCSPLARMEMALGVLEHHADEKQRLYVEDVREEVRQMSGLVNELLSFSKAGLLARELELRPVPLAALVREVVARESGDRAEILLEIDEQLAALGEPELLARALGNVVRNAVRYAGAAGPIYIGALARGAGVVLSVTDNGPGVPADSVHRLFDPFFRPEAARTREGGGSGLGLAIVKTCVEACGGRVTVQNVNPHGLQVDFALQRAS